jgi:tripartite-type tricarboxylate transporter receptor subunit TctC
MERLMALPRATIIFAALLAWLGTAVAEDYPTRPIRLVVPYAAGGPSDLSARLVSQALGQNLNVAVIVDNRSGAGGFTGTEQVFQAEPDGYTLLLGAIGPLVFMPAARSVPYDVKADFVPLGLIWQSPLVLVINPNKGIKSVAELIAYAKAHPGKLTVASAGVGTNTHMASELFKHEAGIDWTHVPYRSTGAVLPDLLSGQVDAEISDVALMTPYIRQGSLIALAVTAPGRSPLLPEVPTMAEAGLPGAYSENWYGLLALRQTPPNAIARLKTALDATVANPAFRESLAKEGAVIRETGGDAFAAFIQSETDRWAPIVRETGIKF